MEIKINVASNSLAIPSDCSIINKVRIRYSQLLVEMGGGILVLTLICMPRKAWGTYYANLNDQALLTLFRKRRSLI